jgi:hypothetical protein
MFPSIFLKKLLSEAFFSNESLHYRNQRISRKLTNSPGIRVIGSFRKVIPALGFFYLSVRNLYIKKLENTDCPF